MRVLFLLCCLYSFAYGQTVTAFPSLDIPPSSRGLAMGNTGIASAVANQQLFYNMAKTAFTQNFHQVSLTYMPWLPAVSNDSRLMHVNYLANISNTSSIGAALTYLDYGSFTARDNNGASVAIYRPREYNLGISYALQIGANASLGLTLKTIGGNDFSEVPKNIFSMCGDIGYYQFVNLGDVNRKLEWGATITNLGPKIVSQDGTNKTSLPSHIGIGFGYSSTNSETGDVLVLGLDANKLVSGPYSATQFSFGAEYGIVNSFFLRGGLHLEKQDEGNRKYIGLGVGYKGYILDQSCGIDFHYLVPVGVVSSVSPFENSFGFTLHLSFGNFQ